MTARQYLVIQAAMTLCRCYEADAAVPMFMVVPMNEFLTQTRAASRSAKPFCGHCGQYFSVLNSDSEYGLSSLTLGRLCDGVTPRSYIFCSMVTDLIGAPLSECSTG